MSYYFNVTLCEIPGLGIGDVFDLTTSTQYEIETTSHSRFLRRRKEDFASTGVEIIVIPLRGLPPDPKGRERGWRVGALKRSLRGM